MRSQLENDVPGLSALRDAERLNRALAFAAVSRAVCGVELVPLTPRHRLALQLTRNAFAEVGALPEAGDVFSFLWVLSPNYRPPGNLVRNLISDVRQWFLRRHVKRLDIPTARGAIFEFIAAQLQDSSESTTGGEGEDQSPWVSWVAQDASWWINVHGGFTLETYLGTPYLVLQQLYRGWKCNNPSVTYGPNGEPCVESPQFINESDRALGRHLRQFRDQVAEKIKQQTNRLP